MERTEDLLAKVDEVRKRIKVSYEEAKHALDVSGEDTLAAVIYLEREKGERYDDLKEYKDKTVESIKKTSGEMVTFSFHDKSVEAPLPVAVIGALLLARKPKLLLGLVGGILTFGVDVKLQRGEKEICLTKPVHDKLRGLVSAFGLNKSSVKRKLGGVSEKIHFKKTENEEEDFHGYFSPELY